MIFFYRESKSEKNEGGGGGGAARVSEFFTKNLNKKRNIFFSEGEGGLA